MSPLQRGWQGPHAPGDMWDVTSAQGYLCALHAVSTLSFVSHSLDESHYSRVGEQIATGWNQDEDQRTGLVYDGSGFRCLTSSHLMATCQRHGGEESRRNRPFQHLHSGLLVSRTVRGYIFHVLRHRVVYFLTAALGKPFTNHIKEPQLGLNLPS